MCLGRPGVVERTWEERGVPMGLVRTGETTESACLLIEPGTRAGDRVLVHMGFVVEVQGSSTPPRDRPPEGVDPP